jgi:hypothetical protein
MDLTPDGLQGGANPFVQLAASCASHKLYHFLFRQIGRPFVGHGHANACSVPTPFASMLRACHTCCSCHPGVLVGRTDIGRATVAVLDINDPQRDPLRSEFGEVGG